MLLKLFVYIDLCEWNHDLIQFRAYTVFLIMNSVCYLVDKQFMAKSGGFGNLCLQLSYYRWLKTNIFDRHVIIGIGSSYYYRYNILAKTIMYKLVFHYFLNSQIYLTSHFSSTLEINIIIKIFRNVRNFLRNFTLSNYWVLATCNSLTPCISCCICTWSILSNYVQHLAYCFIPQLLYTMTILGKPVVSLAEPSH